MSSTGSVSHWLDLLRGGDDVAAQQLWERYFQRLVLLARERLRTAPRAMADEEDVALSAFDSFCRDAQRGRFPQLADRDDLWRLLMTITAQKGFDHVRREQARKRGGGQARVDDDEVLAQVVGREPTPELAAQVAEECRRLLDALPDPELRQIAVCKLEGYTNAEIAGRLGTVEKTVQRRLGVIRKEWGHRQVSPTPARPRDGGPGDD